MTRYLLLFMTIALFACFRSGSEGYEVGDYARDFELKSVDGSTVSMSDYEDAKGFQVIFTCNHCPFAQAYEDRIKQLHKEFAPKGYPVLAISPNDPEKVPEDSFDNMKERAEKEGYPFPYMIDETQEIAKTYGATRTPHVYLLDKEAEEKYRVAYIGAIDDNTYNPEKVEKKYLRNAINALMNGEEPEPSHTKAVGCTIKWANK